MPKYARRLAGFNEQILSLYARAPLKFRIPNVTLWSGSGSADWSFALNTVEAVLAATLIVCVIVGHARLGSSSPPWPPSRCWACNSHWCARGRKSCAFAEAAFTSGHTFADL